MAVRRYWPHGDQLWCVVSGHSVSPIFLFNFISHIWKKKNVRGFVMPQNHIRVVILVFVNKLKQSSSDLLGVAPSLMTHTYTYIMFLSFPQYRSLFIANLINTVNINVYNIYLTNYASICLHCYMCHAASSCVTFFFWCFLIFYSHSPISC